MPEATRDRVVRMLAIVALLGSGEPISVAELAKRFGVPEKRIDSDVRTLMMAGLPGYFPNDLIDFDLDRYYDEQVVVLRDGQGVDTPLRLAPHEAIALIAALQAIESMFPAGTEAHDLVSSVRSKVSTATDIGTELVSIKVETGKADLLEGLRQAVTQHKVVELSYVRSDDVLTHRMIEPLVLTVKDAHTYLLAWSREVAAERVFRLDRIVSAQITEETFTAREVSTMSAYSPPAHAGEICIHVRAGARWVAEDIPVSRVVDAGDGTYRIWMRLANRVWLRQLLLRIAGEVITVLPPELAVEAGAAARQALAVYERLDDLS